MLNLDILASNINRRDQLLALADHMLLHLLTIQFETVFLLLAHFTLAPVQHSQSIPHCIKLTENYCVWHQDFLATPRNIKTDLLIVSECCPSVY